MLKGLILTSALASTAFAQSAIIVVEAFGGAVGDVTNTTIEVPIGSPYTNSSVLDKVSFLYLVDSTGVAKGSITCNDYKSNDGTGPGGLPFNLTTPGLLSTNTVQVGSIVCNTTEPVTGPLQGSSSSSAPAPTSSGSATSSGSVTWYMPVPTNKPNTTMIPSWSSGNYGPTTKSESSEGPHPTGGNSSIWGGSVPVVTTVVPPTSAVPSTITTTLAPQSSAEPTGSSQTGGSSPTSASATPTPQNAAIRSELAYGGLAAALMGFAFIL